jgi:hypothetical protein
MRVVGWQRKGLTKQKGQSRKVAGSWQPRLPGCARPLLGRENWGGSYSYTGCVGLAECRRLGAQLRHLLTGERAAGQRLLLLRAAKSALVYSSLPRVMLHLNLCKLGELDLVVDRLRDKGDVSIVAPAGRQAGRKKAGQGRREIATSEPQRGAAGVQDGVRG